MSMGEKREKHTKKRKLMDIVRGSEANKTNNE